jgi:TPR repeat protein
VVGNAGVTGEPGQQLRVVLSWYLKSARRKDPEAMMRIGDLYRIGRDAPRDPARAWTWYMLAAGEGSADAAVRAAEFEEHLSREQLTAAQEELSSLAVQLGEIAGALSRAESRANRRPIQ